MYKPLQCSIFIVLVLLLLASCRPAQSAVVSTPLSPSINTSIPTFTDEELAIAVQQAQETLYIWRQEFLAPKESYSMMSLKVRFAADGEVEDMWTEPLYILDNTYTVRMVEGVTLDKGIHPGRMLDVKPEDIVDWMMLQEDGTLLGGYTLRLEYERMTPEQQKKYIEITGIDFEKGKE
jgi:uncharacterized protein YegJ (DUF2314 family)